MRPVLIADHAVFERLGDAEDAAEIARVEIGGKAELRGVRLRDHVRLVLEAVDRRQRAEGLLARHQHLGRDVGEHGRLEERCGRAHGACRRPRPSRPCPTASAIWRSTLSTASMVISGPWTTPTSMPLPTFSSIDLLGEPRDEVVVDAFLRVDAVRADAGLAHVAELRDDRAFDRGVEIGVVEDDEGRVAAEFEADLLHRRGGLRASGACRPRSSR